MKAAGKANFPCKGIYTSDEAFADLKEALEDALNSTTKSKAGTSTHARSLKLDNLNRRHRMRQTQTIYRNAFSR